ncbi:ATP-binding cassette domain-containing protein (plasmid) [Rhizobium sp. CB3060]|uniref:ABC transporter ATP-binding protein n=1 Tax=unclassified Rhizobium TaxID=2613769 RepID=UPI0021A6C296|nr:MULTISPECIES: ATP-binding cassette domain-containing protein [Rhizobium]MDK4740330.1 ATP-binding cassette domain-containing protein [Rhizobium sp. CNPSo 3464]UWU24652.1 ATP-binding cassette domain-containing protein [Rhizobium tropici]
MTDDNFSPLLELKNVSKTFLLKPLFGQEKRVDALRNVSLKLEAGRALAIVGESGSGKSTVGRAVTRLFQPTSGNILFAGRDIGGLTTAADQMSYLRMVQMVFQDPFAALNPAHRIRHHLFRPLILHQGLKGDALKAAARQTLADVELDPNVTLDKYPHELSGGQRQRVNLARALAVDARLIVADEPTSMLDVSIRRSVLDLMRRLKLERGIGFLYITHDIATAHYIAEDTAVMFAGQIVEYGPSASVIRNPQHPYTRLLLSAVPDPAVRIAGRSGEQGQSFSTHAETVRDASRRPVGQSVEVTPGHFVFHHIDMNPSTGEAA